MDNDTLVQMLLDAVSGVVKSKTDGSEMDEESSGVVDAGVVTVLRAVAMYGNVKQKKIATDFLETIIQEGKDGREKIRAILLRLDINKKTKKEKEVVSIPNKPVRGL